MLTRLFTCFVAVLWLLVSCEEKPSPEEEAILNPIEIISYDLSFEGVFVDWSSASDQYEVLYDIFVNGDIVDRVSEDEAFVNLEPNTTNTLRIVASSLGLADTSVEFELPIYESNLLLAANHAGFLEAFDLVSQERIWQIEANTKQIAVIDQVVYFQKDLALVAVDLFSGREMWSRALECDIEQIAVNTDYIVLGDLCYQVQILNRVSGSLVKLLSRDVYEDAFPITLDQENLYLAESEFNNLYSFRLSDGSLNWQVPTSGPVYANPLVDQERIYVPAIADFSCYDKNTGAQLWSFRKSVGPIERAPSFSAPFKLFIPVGRDLYEYDTAGNELAFVSGASDNLINTPIANEDYALFAMGNIWFVLNRQKGENVEIALGEHSASIGALLFDSTIVLPNGNTVLVRDIENPHQMKTIELGGIIRSNLVLVKGNSEKIILNPNHGSYYN